MSKETLPELKEKVWRSKQNVGRKKNRETRT
jgi:hypothetical protein